MENTTSLLIDPSAVTAIGTELKTNITGIAPAIVGVMAVVIVAGVVLAFIKRHSSTRG